MSVLKTNDKVMWRGSFGKDAPIETTVKSIEVCQDGNKNGKSVTSIDWDKVDSRNVVLDLTNGHWCYGNQISEIKC